MPKLAPKATKPRSAAAGWAECVGELDKMCNVLARRFGQDPLDVWGDVGAAVVHAHAKYDPARNPNYGAWCRWKVWEYLKGRARTRRRSRRREVQPGPDYRLESAPSACAAPWPIDEWADALPARARPMVRLAALAMAVEDTAAAAALFAAARALADARTVVLLAVGQPPAVRAVLARAGGESPANVRRAVRLVLKRDGWDEDRLQAAFAATRDAVAGLHTPHFKPADRRSKED